MWKLINQVDNTRHYENATTGSKCTTARVYLDKEGNEWWGFEDLMAMPYTRNFAAVKINSLFALGLTRDDITLHIDGLKTILKSDDPEKYEKAFSNILDFETKAAMAADPVKQQSSLVCVYYLLNDEPIDSFLNHLQLIKISLLEADINMHGFFLKRQIDLIENYTTRLNLLSQIVLPKENGQQGVLNQS